MQLEACSESSRSKDLIQSCSSGMGTRQLSMRRRRASARRAFSSGITGWERLGIAATETVVWGCLGFSILLADLVLQWQELHRTRPIPAKAQAASH